MCQNYDHLAEAYRRNRELHPQVLQYLLDLIRANATTRVLEIGCGTGNYISAIAAAKEAICAGVDPSREMLRIARSNPGSPRHRRMSDTSHVTFLHGTAEELPLPDRLQDLAFSVDVIHHVQNRKQAARELSRVLQPGGHGVIVTESEDDLRNRTPQVRYFPETLDVELRRYPTLDTIEAELAGAGFEVLARTSISVPQQVSDIAPFRDKAFSSLHLIAEDAFARGLSRLEENLKKGPIQGERRYTIVTAHRSDEIRFPQFSLRAVDIPPGP